VASAFTADERHIEDDVAYRCPTVPMGLSQTSHAAGRRIAVQVLSRMSSETAGSRNGA